MELFLLVVTTCVAGVCSDHVEDWNLSWDDCQWEVKGYWEENEFPYCIFDKYEE